MWGESILSATATTSATSSGLVDYAAGNSAMTYWMNTGQGLSMTAGTSYAGYGAWGQQGVIIPNRYGDARIQMQRDRDPHSMNIRLGARIEVGHERRAIEVPVWSDWVQEAYSSPATQHSYSVTFDRQVWQQWITTEPQSEHFARQHLGERVLQQTDEEFQRRAAEMQRAATEQAQGYQERIDKERAKKVVAEETAQVLLGELIGENELAVYKETGRILVKGKRHDYMIHVGGKVQRIEKNRIVDLCVHVSQRPLIPDTDNIIGLKLHIMDDEQDFNKTANLVKSVGRSSVELPRAANG